MAKSSAKRKPRQEDEAPVSSPRSDYESVLDTVMENVEQPKPVPTGTWELQGVSATFKEARDEKDVDNVLFMYTPITPQDDVDEEEVAAGEWKGAKIFFRIRVEGSAGLWALRSHLEKHGIDMSGGKTLKEALKAFGSVKPKILAAVSIRSWTDQQTGEVRVDNNLKAFAPIG